VDAWISTFLVPRAKSNVPGKGDNGSQRPLGGQEGYSPVCGPVGWKPSLSLVWSHGHDAHCNLCMHYWGSRSEASNRDVWVFLVVSLGAFAASLTDLLFSS
jgi:hypothetical protein